MRRPRADREEKRVIHGNEAGATVTNRSSTENRLTMGTPIREDSQVGSWVLNNQTSSQGQSATFNVTAGQPVVLAEWNSTTNTQFFSIPGLNPDGDQHAYLANVNAGQLFTGSPAGYYVGWEDLAAFQGGDFDYNDTQIIVSGVLATPGPTPGVGLAGLAALALFGAARLRRA